MGRQPLTASERRGILIVAIISLLITGAGLCVSYCGRNGADSTPPPTEPELLYTPADDTTNNRSNPTAPKSNTDSTSKITQTDSAKSDKKDSAKGDKKNSAEKSKSKRTKKQPKTYRRRSPIDEPV